MKRIPGPSGPKGDRGDSGYVGPSGMMGMTGAQGAPGAGYDGVLQSHVKLRAEDGQEMTVNEIVDFIKVMKERMFIIEPNFTKHEQYSALKEIYEQYQVMEKLFSDNLNSDI